jgi:acetyl-CoA carboxylase carboxyl transferase subunit alpha
LIDKIIDEPLGGAHRDIQKMSSMLSDHISEQLEKCSSLNISDLLNERHKKIMSYGAIE